MSPGPTGSAAPQSRRCRGRAHDAGDGRGRTASRTGRSRSGPSLRRGGTFGSDGGFVVGLCVVLVEWCPRLWVVGQLLRSPSAGRERPVCWSGSSGWPMRSPGRGSLPWCSSARHSSRGGGGHAPARSDGADVRRRDRHWSCLRLHGPSGHRPTSGSLAGRLGVVAGRREPGADAPDRFVGGPDRRSYGAVRE